MNKIDKNTLFDMECLIDRKTIICGIDEAGRGSIAGSLFVCGVLCSIVDIENISNITDSKKLTRKARDEIFNKVLSLEIPYFVASFNANEIDNIGISKCMQSALSTIKQSLNTKKYIFDGNTNFGVKGIDCIVKGDSHIPQISLASIIAKSLKDKESDELHIKYPHYKLDKHKGYGTKEHIEAIKQYGLLPIHRKTFKIKSIS
ncbi:ribonuclease HII [Helicobacter sp. 16-1353]|uniref:ribonuclease HII n=1 Tax=Helicobacter sp. 16-1353 TaxID=2004996 RepID=UPI000DCEC13E|nr:ribonuclease HII [Helicobacter sp. 16-1353]RAX54244.1 ribonuclease HII [Helicobacter sp. 16-1353]